MVGMWTLLLETHTLSLMCKAVDEMPASVRVREKVARVEYEVVTEQVSFKRSRSW